MRRRSVHTDPTGGLRRVASAFVLAITACLCAPAAWSAPAVISLDADDVVRSIPVLPQAGDTPRAVPVGAFCPAPSADPFREASTFGASALLMWMLARRRGDHARGA